MNRSDSEALPDLADSPAPGIGKRIRTVRERQGLSQAKFAARLDRSEGAVQQWETEKLTLTQSACLHIALTFGADPNWIWADDGALPGWATETLEQEAPEEAALVLGVQARIDELDIETAARHSELLSKLAQVHAELEALRRQLPPPASSDQAGGSIQ
jgi:transcriptional regulator with XRE-family HTH domain